MVKKMFENCPGIEWLLACPPCKDHTQKNTSGVSLTWDIESDTPSARGWRAVSDRLEKDTAAQLGTCENVAGMLRKIRVGGVGEPTTARDVVLQRLNRGRFRAGTMQLNPRTHGLPNRRGRLYFTVLGPGFGTAEERTDILGRVHKRGEELSQVQIEVGIEDFILPNYNKRIIQHLSERENTMKKRESQAPAAKKPRVSAETGLRG